MSNQGFANPTRVPKFREIRMPDKLRAAEQLDQNLQPQRYCDPRPPTQKIPPPFKRSIASIPSCRSVPAGPGLDDGVDCAFGLVRLLRFAPAFR
jgi:hypothetical protein